MEDNEEKIEEVGPYRATRNLNTIISNPDANINDTMDINIKVENSKETTEKEENDSDRKIKYDANYINDIILKNTKSDDSDSKEDNDSKNDSKQKEEKFSLIKIIKLGVLGILIILAIVLTVILIKKIM